MKKILGLLTSIGVTGNKGLIGLVSEKTGKLSFKRVGAIMIISWIVKNVEPQNLTNGQIALMIGALIAIALPKIFSKED